MSSCVNIHKKMLSIISEIKGVGENGYNSYNKYNYIKQEDIINTIKPLLLKNNLIVLSNVVDEETVIIEGRGILCKVTMNFTIVDIENGEELTETYKGHGIDPGDKSIYKAMTGAEKYFYMKNFLIGAVNDDPEYNGANEAYMYADRNGKNNDKGRNYNKNFNRNDINSSDNTGGFSKNNRSDTSNFNVDNSSNIVKPKVINEPKQNKQNINESEKTIDIRLQKLLFTAANQEKDIVFNAINKLGYKSPEQVKINEYKKVLAFIKEQVKLIDFS